MNKLRKTKTQKGITLIALIITIIVLLILAVVAIGAVQNDGIIEHAKNARNKYELAQEKENTALGNYLAKLNENNQNGNNTTSVFASITPENYGDTIEYSAGDVDDWKVFYKDDTHLYIIASDYLEKDNLPTGLNMTAGHTYGGYWNEPDYDLTASKASDSITTAIANKYKLSWFSDTTKDSTDETVRATADLLNVAIWTAKFGNAEKGIEAIGAPTLEMWVASWNAKGTAKNTAETTKYVPLKTEHDESGYFVGPTTTESLSEIADDYEDSLGGYYYNVGTSTDGYADTLYFPYTSMVDYCIGYWLASPSSCGGWSLPMVDCINGYVGHEGIYICDEVAAARPLVSLPSDVITTNSDGSLKVVQ